MVVTVLKRRNNCLIPLQTTKAPQYQLNKTTHDINTLEAHAHINYKGCQILQKPYWLAHGNFTRYQLACPLSFTFHMAIGECSMGYCSAEYACTV